ncbi:MAG TPA: nucleoside triphosphate pyrophosphohydrolase [Candidatus Dormibacteraeota bacterium]|nr:nucleoside triphosphate pyrophosphohydrolase [Candidatus Dormibacteraeota bacterium]
MKIYNKLVRDKIPKVIKANGNITHTHVLSDDKEYLMALMDKLFEEAQELKDDLSLEELADVLEVIYAIGEKLGYTANQIEAARVAKMTLRGGFNDRIFLESVDE